MPSSRLKSKNPTDPKHKLENIKLANFKSEFFKTLANPLRIRILDQLRHNELTVSEIRDKLDVELPNVSQQLAILKGRKFVQSRKQGNNIYYSCTNTSIFKLLDVAKEEYAKLLIDLQDTLKDL